MSLDLRPRWALATAQPTRVAELVRSAGISPLMAQCLINRGHLTPDAAARHLDPRLRALADPFALPDMRAAVDRLFRARAAGDTLVIFGDYDVDGVTSTALLSEVLTSLGWRVHSYLPHRLEEGYGLSQGAVERCLERYSAKLLVAVDCGSTAVGPIRWLRERGVDTLVLDHHQAPEPRPDVVALVNPQCGARTAGPPPFAELCSVGLAFKLAHALLKHGRDLGESGFAEFDLRKLLDLVALGTVADLVPLIGENRILVTAGLERLSRTDRPGLMALKSVAQCQARIGVYEVGFQLGPRLNAAGRLETADEALRLLQAPNLTAAEPLAASLDARNRERQQIERTMTDEVVGAVRSRFDPARDFVIVEGRLLWHIGVVGIVASRVLREFYRPTLILGGEAGEWRGSGRSIAGFDLAAALRECDDLLLKHGGHAMAAGISIEPSRVEALRERLNRLAAAQLTPDLLRPLLRLDAETTPAALTVEGVEDLQRLGPFGQENPDLQFSLRNVTIAGPVRRLGKEQQHAKWMLSGAGGLVECVWWNCAGRALPEGRFDVAGAPSINEFNGRRTVQLKLLDWRPAEA